MSIFKRSSEVDLLVNKLHNKKIKIVAGLRRCGKTYLLDELFHRRVVSRHIVNEDEFFSIYLSDKHKEYRDADKFKKLLDSNIVKPKIIFIDEVQEVDGYYKILIDYLKDHPDVDLYVTGSNSNTLSKDIVRHFKEYGDPIYIYPLTFDEIRKVKRKYSFDDYLRYGGLPDVVNDNKKSSTTLEDIYKTLYLLDVKDRANKEGFLYLSDKDMDDIVDNIFSSTTDFSLKKVVDRILKKYKKDKDDVLKFRKEISDFISILEESFLIIGMPNTSNRPKAPLDILGIDKKYYCSDCGIAYFLCSVKNHKYSVSLETATFLFFKHKGIDMQGYVLLRDNNDKDGEIDFTCNQLGENNYYQVTYEINEGDYAREIKIFENFGADIVKNVVYVRNLLPEETGINYLNAEEFLEDNKKK